MNQVNTVRVYRNDVLESTHKVHVAVVNNKGELLYSVGDPNHLTYARSSLKPFQAVPLITSGTAEHYQYTPEEIAVSCASHSGEAIHRETVGTIFNKINEGEDRLICGPHIPRDQKGYEKWISEGNSLTKIFNNCSGKHASMIANCKYTNKDIESYYKKDHPLQVEIKSIIEDVCEIPENEISSGEDGCGLPVYNFPLKNLALGFCKLGNPEKSDLGDALAEIRDGMIQAPHLVAGKDRFDTDAMTILTGKMISKMGAEGVQGIGLVDQGIGIAIKVEDGANRGADICAVHVLDALGIINDEERVALQSYFEPAILNTLGETVGHISFDLELEKE